MVNLAKIRKKAKEKKKEVDVAAGVPPAAPPGESDSAAKSGGAAGETHSSLRSSGQAPAATVDKLERFRETAGIQPAAIVASTAAEAAPEGNDETELLTFILAGEQYAIDIERIAEIISPRPVTPVPNAPAPVVGIISLRGTIVTMLDLRRELGHPAASAAGDDARTIVVEDEGGMAGFVVDRVLRVVKVDPSQMQSHPVVSAAEQREAIRGVFQLGSALTIVLDVGRLLSRDSSRAIS